MSLVSKLLTGVPKFFERVLPQVAEAAFKSPALDVIKKALSKSKETMTEPVLAKETRAPQEAEAEAAEILTESRHPSPKTPHTLF